MRSGGVPFACDFVCFFLFMWSARSVMAGGLAAPRVARRWVLEHLVTSAVHITFRCALRRSRDSWGDVPRETCGAADGIATNKLREHGEAWGPVALVAAPRLAAPRLAPRRFAPSAPPLVGEVGEPKRNAASRHETRHGDAKRGKAGRREAGSLKTRRSEAKRDEGDAGGTRGTRGRARREAAGRRYGTGGRDGAGRAPRCGLPLPSGEVPHSRSAEAIGDDQRLEAPQLGPI